MAEKWWQRYIKLASAVLRMNMRRRSERNIQATISHWWLETYCFY